MTASKTFKQWQERHGFAEKPAREDYAAFCARHGEFPVSVTFAVSPWQNGSSLLFPDGATASYNDSNLWWKEPPDDPQVQLQYRRTYLETRLKIEMPIFTAFRDFYMAAPNAAPCDAPARLEASHALIRKWQAELVEVAAQIVPDPMPGPEEVRRRHDSAIIARQAAAIATQQVVTAAVVPL
jgi:hypothetical protein